MAEILNSLGATALLSNAKSQIWGLGVTQAVDAAAMNLYAGYFVETADITLMNQSATAAVQTRKSNAVESFSTFYSGATIRF